MEHDKPAQDANATKEQQKKETTPSKFVFNSPSTNHASANRNDGDTSGDNGGENIVTEKPRADFSFTKDSHPKFRPHLKPKSRRAGRPGYTAQKSETPGPTLEKILRGTSAEGKARLGTTLSGSAECKTPAQTDSDEDTQDLMAQASTFQFGSANPMPISSMKTVDLAQLLSAVEAMDLAKNLATNTPSISPRTKTQPSRNRKPSPKQSIFIPFSSSPTSRPSQSGHRVPPSTTTTTTLHHLQPTTSPDANNTFYHPSLTLQTTAQKLARTFRAATAFTAHYPDAQIVPPKTFKPLVMTQMQNMVRDLRWAAQFLQFGKLGWDLVRLPHEFWEDLKGWMASLRTSIKKLWVRRGLGFLGEGMTRVDEIERAVWGLQGRRRGKEREREKEREKEKKGKRGIQGEGAV